MDIYGRIRTVASTSSTARDEPSVSVKSGPRNSLKSVGSLCLVCFALILVSFILLVNTTFGELMALCG